MNVVPTRFSLKSYFMAGIMAMALLSVTCVNAESPYEVAYEALHILEEEGWNVREDYYEKPLEPSVGRGIRVQLFRGNDYVFVAALADEGETSSLRIQILDSEGKVVVDEDKPFVKGRVIITNFRPRKTGLYVVAIRQVSKKTRNCALFMGYK
jgi:hypothetical protein